MTTLLPFKTSMLDSVVPSLSINTKPCQPSSSFVVSYCGADTFHPLADAPSIVSVAAAASLSATGEMRSVPCRRLPPTDDRTSSRMASVQPTSSRFPSAHKTDAISTKHNSNRSCLFMMVSLSGLLMILNLKQRHKHGLSSQEACYNALETTVMRLLKIILA